MKIIAIKSSITLILTLLLFTSAHPVTPEPSEGTLKIRFQGVRNGKGQIAIGMNRTPEGWPRTPDLSYDWKKENIQNGVFIAEIKNLPYGKYAVSVLDDENSNFEMDMTLGIPREGYGFSNNPRVGLKPPDFEECNFSVNSGTTEITIKMIYVGKSKAK